MLTFKAGVLITNLHGFLNIYELTYIESICASFFTILLLINSFNLIDGVDGLAASLGLIACLFFGIIFFMNNILLYAVLSFAMCGALIAFLLYNFPPAKIFMGDSGSTIIGLMCAILSIKFIENPSIQSSFNSNAVPAIAFGFLLIPLMDVLRVFTLRIVKKQSPLTPDRNHLHHLLQNKGLSHTEVTSTLLAAQFVFCIIGLLLSNININLIVAVQFSLYFGSAYMLKKYIPRRKKLHIVRNHIAEDISADVKVYPIYPAKEKLSLSED
jgi:UDP-N-acetylmuramyl pentapeptide phosphotransferase/UDP-N-acetylglucosamine-1-phosphate transferase